MKKLLIFSVLLRLAEVCQGLSFTTEFIYVTINEEEPSGSFVARARAGPGPVRYELGGDAGKLFAINGTTGKITVKGHIDREVLNATGGSFNVFAFDDLGDKASASVRYWILDVNDHIPKFPSQYYRVTVGESIDVNQEIFSVTAEDEDLEANAEILYEIADGNEDGMFKLKDDYHCNVLVAKALDYESKTSYVLNITASNYQKGFSNWTIVLISVADEDDLPARFSAYEYNAVVREDASVGTSILKVTATDQDQLNSSVTYEIAELTNKSDLFVINASTGVISLNGTLDREITQQYRIQVLARSTFHLPDHVTVIIQIGDVNDNRPVFSDQSYSFVIGENAGIGSIVGQVKATDTDQGNNATFSYFLLGSENRFTVDSLTGLITVNGSLDREKQENYSIVILSKETQTVEQYSSNVSVVINVEDRNDNTPRFLKTFYNVTLEEELPSGTSVIQVFANDSDASSNADVTYSFVPDVNDHYLSFNINPKNGSITTVKQLDREDIGEYYLTVKAKDNASKDHKRSSTVSVRVTLQDVNDNTPAFDEQSYSVTVSEATDVNSTILKVKATDRDAGQNSDISYTLNDRNLGNVFKIEHSSGAISIAEYLDREKVDVYSLVVTAKDGGNKSMTVNITLHVSDVNDNSPQFTSPGGYQFSVVEGIAGLIAGVVTATDSDFGENAEIIYSLMSTPASKSYRINSSTGVISTAQALDRESFRSHLLIVQAEDKGVLQSRRTAVQVSINVTDVNDNAPKFFEASPDLNSVEHNLLCGSYNTTDFIVILVKDFTPANTEIGRVKSFDKDEAVNAKTFYRIQGNASEVFSISSHTGVIQTKRQLKREEKTAYNLTVIAENSLASPKLSSNVTVHVIVYDVSDHKPQFTRSEYQAEVAESVVVGTSVIKINVTNNEQATSKFVFRILYDQSSTDSRKFVIEPETGLITTQGQLDRETTSNYTLKVQAKVLNTALPEVFSSIVSVVINVTDVDDNSPRFVQRSYRFTPSELTSVGDFIGQVRAVDIDGDSQLEVFYTILGGNEKGLFNISEDLGKIYLIRTLEQDANSTYHLVIRARDTPVGVSSRKRRGDSGAFDEVTVTIEVQDENNNPPVFIQEHFIGAFYESEVKENTVVAKVEAVDNDLGAYGSVQYSIVHAENPWIFSVAPITGEVTLSNSSALVSGKLKYTLEVSAVDNLGEVPFNRAKQNASVHIFVLSDSNQLSLEIGVHPEFAQEKIDEINSMLRNLTGANVIIKDIQESGDGNFRSIIYFHAIDNSLHVLNQEDFMSRLLNKTDLTGGVFTKWNIHMPSGGSAEMSTGSREEFSAVIAAMLVLSVGIGVAGIIGIIVTCRKRKRDKTVYKTNEISDSSFPHATVWYSMDIPGIETFTDSKTEGTPRSLRSHTKYTVQKEQPGIPSPSLASLRTPLRSSKAYKVKNEAKKDVERKEAVALNHYGAAPISSPDHNESNETYETLESVTTKTTTVINDLESHENAGFDDNQGQKKVEEGFDDNQGQKKIEEGFDDNQGQKKIEEGFDDNQGQKKIEEGFDDNQGQKKIEEGFDDNQGQKKVEERPGQKGKRQCASKSVEEKPDKREANNKNRRVRFASDLSGSEERKVTRKQKRSAMGQIPDIIVITEQERARGGNHGNQELDESEKEQAVVDDEKKDDTGDGHDNMPADITSLFEDSRKVGRGSGDPAQTPTSSYASTVSDEEGTVMEI